MNREHKLFIVSILLLVGINIFVWSYTPQAPDTTLTVSFLDVGQGDAVFIEVPNGKQMLIDGGKNSSMLSALGEQIDFQDRDIDVVLVTHPHADHIGGLPEVFDRFNVHYFIDTGLAGEDNTYRTLIDKVSSETSVYKKGERGLTIILDKKNGVYFQILAPDERFNYKDPNDMSIVGRLVYKDSSFLLTGDASKAIENILVYSDGNLLDSDILKAGHHGSKTASGLLFLETVTPDASIISASSDNSYGHPHISVLQNLESVGSEILETSKEGTITFETDGTTIWRK